MAFTCKRKPLKKSYEFLKYARAYLCKGRYAPGQFLAFVEHVFAIFYQLSGFGRQSVCSRTLTRTIE